MFNKRIFFYLIFILCAGCSSGQSGQGSQTLTVATQPNTTTLFLDGTIAPLQVYSVNSPIDGAVAQKNFEIGATVKQGQALVTLKSSQLADDYQTAVTDYLKAKKDYLTNQSQMDGTIYLKKMGIISDQDYQTAVSTNYDLNVAYNQATEKLQNMLGKLGEPTDISKLNLDDTQVSKLFTTPITTLSINAPVSGIALIPDKSTSSSTVSGDAISLLPIGSQVKNGDTLLTIGDMSGISVEVKVNELHIDDIHDGLTAIVTSDAFPGISLQGQVASVVDEAESSEGSSAPSFPIKVIVPKLTDAQRKIIHVGMSAKVQLQLISTPAIKVPISAVITANGLSQVKIINAKTKKPTLVAVQTGATTLDSVEITQGLKDGDKVVLNP